MTDPLEKPDGLNWDPAAVELPEVPLLPPGEDAMSTTIAGVLPTLTVPLATSVAALSAKENMFRGKLGTAETAYQNADDSGQQSMGQLAGMLGQVGQLGQSAGAPAQAAGGLGGQTGMFGSLMQQAMQGAQGGGSGGQGVRRAGSRYSGRRRPGPCSRGRSTAATARRRRRRRKRSQRTRRKNPSTTNARPCSAPRPTTAPWPDRPEPTTAGPAQARPR